MYGIKYLIIACHMLCVFVIDRFVSRRTLFCSFSPFTETNLTAGTLRPLDYSDAGLEKRKEICQANSYRSVLVAVLVAHICKNCFLRLKRGNIRFSVSTVYGCFR
jgi:hypothetical protein